MMAQPLAQIGANWDHAAQAAGNALETSSYHNGNFADFTAPHPALVAVFHVETEAFAAAGDR